jgi:PAS domain S-box-containing protein
MKLPPRTNKKALELFTERLTQVLEAINELSKSGSFDELCYRSMELAIERLGFDRIGLCFLSEDQQTVLGCYGTDESGHLRNEKHLRRPVSQTPTVKRLLKNGKPVVFFEKEILYDDKLVQVGVGDHAVARLWNGEKITGILAVDNLIHRKSITEYDLKILGLYATGLGHLSTLKQTEEALRESEYHFRTLFEQAVVGVAQIETKTGKFLKANQHFCYIVGYSVMELQKLTFVELTHPDDLASEQNSRRSSAIRQMQEYSVDKRLRRKNGSFVWVNQTISTMQPGEEGQNYQIAVIQDIAERKRMEEFIRSEIREKEVLLQEIHHRVKNNMQIIISLLDLQVCRSQDPVLIDSFKASKDRIYSMALVHEMLYQSHDLSSIDFSVYLENLARTILDSFGADPGRITLEMDLRPIELKVENAVPCGLIAQELFSNALKYAFPRDWNRKAKIRIGFKRVKNEIELLVADNGIGLPENIDIKLLDSFGLRLVQMLGEKQLGGKVHIKRKNGTQIALRFRETRG